MVPTTLAPFLSVRNGARTVGFYKSAFGAEEIFRHEDPSGSWSPISCINVFFTASGSPTSPPNTKKLPAPRPSTATPSHDSHH